MAAFRAWEGLPICTLLGQDCAASSQRLTLALQRIELYKYACGNEEPG